MRKLVKKMIVLVKVFCLYRGDTIGQVVFAGDTQELILWELISTEGARGCVLLHLCQIRVSEQEQKVE